MSDDRTHPAEPPAEDAWAYTPEYRARVKQARRDYAEGRTVMLSMEQLEELADNRDKASNPPA